MGAPVAQGPRIMDAKDTAPATSLDCDDDTVRFRKNSIEKQSYTDRTADVLQNGQACPFKWYFKHVPTKTVWHTSWLH